MATLQDEYNACLFHSASALYRRLEKLAQFHFKAKELTPTQGFFLITLKQTPGISIGDLALVHQLDQSTVSRVVDKMSSEGLVTREPFGRTFRLFATDQGIKAEADAMAAWRELQHAYRRAIGREFADALAASITVAIHKLE